MISLSSPVKLQTIGEGTAEQIEVEIPNYDEPIRLALRAEVPDGSEGQGLVAIDNIKLSVSVHTAADYCHFKCVFRLNSVQPSPTQQIVQRVVEVTASPIMSRIATAILCDQVLNRSQTSPSHMQPKRPITQVLTRMCVVCSAASLSLDTCMCLIPKAVP